MAYRTPHICDGMLIPATAIQTTPIRVGSSEWWHWLQHEKCSFAFVSEQGNFTARREYRHGNWYWYGYRKQHKKLHKVYLGKTSELTLERLQTVAELLNASFEQRTQEVQMQASSPTSEVEPLIMPTLPAHLLATKLAVPPLRQKYVPRQALLNRLDYTLQHRLTLVVAPAGFGKTTLLSAWYFEHQSRYTAYAWLSLDSSDNDVMHFWQYLFAALQNCYPALQPLIASLLQTSPLPAIEVLLSPILKLLATASQEIVCMLDDYHLITSARIHESLLFFLDHLTPHMHFIIASRTEPPLALARFRVQNQLYTLDATDLRFTRSETTLFLQEVMGLRLAREEIITLDTYTEGWVAGLQLTALSMQERRVRAKEMCKIFVSGSRYMLEYLTDEVFHQQSEQIRDFLLQTAIVERLSASLCSALTLCQDASQLLKHLEQANLFVLPLDEQRSWYRYHHLFGEFLRHRLHETRPALVPLLHTRASQWYEANGYVLEAVQHALAAMDVQRTATLLQSIAPMMIMRSETARLSHWLTLLPDDVIHERPLLRLYQAGAAIAVGQLDAAEMYERDAAQVFAQMQQQPVEPDALRILEASCYAARTGVAAFRGDLPHTIDYAHKAVALLPESDLFSRSIVLASLGSAYLLTGDLTASYEAYTDAINAGTIINNMHVVLASRVARGYIQALRGQLHQAEEIYQQVIRLGTEQGRLFPVVGMAYACLGELWYEWNDLAKAEQYARESIAVGEQWGYVGIGALAYTVLAAIQYARGNFHEALATMQQATQQQHTMLQISAMVEIAQARLYLLMGNFNSAEQWLQLAANHLSTHSPIAYPRDQEYLVRAQLRIAQGRYDEAEDILTSIHAVLAQDERQRTQLELLLLQAQLRYLQRQHERASVLLINALKLAERESYTRTLLDKGQAMLDLLRSIAHHTSAPSYALTLLRLTEPAHAVWCLSSREMTVLQHIAAGRSNQEIAEAFVVALSTIKTHINNIYTKLGVHSRTQAIARAKELHLL